MPNRPKQGRFDLHDKPIDTANQGRGSWDNYSQLSVSSLCSMSSISRFAASYHRAEGCKEFAPSRNITSIILHD